MRSCMKPLVVIWLMAALGFWGFSLVWADEGPPLGPRTMVVALDGTGDFVSLQEAVDAARKGDTVFVKPGQYPQDVTIHSKEKIKLVGAGVDQVTILGRDIVVGALHVGKWPYGATDIEISDMTINDQGGHAVGLSDHARAVLVSNTLVKNGGGAAFLGQSQSDVTGNVVGLNRRGFVIAPSSQTTTSFNAFYNTDGDYLRVGNPNQPAPELKAQSDITGDPYFVDPGHDDFRLRLDTPLLKIGRFPYLGALAPASTAARRSAGK